MKTSGLVMKDAKQMRLLLVEDNEPLVEVVLPGLRRAGFEVDCARCQSRSKMGQFPGAIVPG